MESALILEKLIAKGDLSSEEIEWVFSWMLTWQLSEAVISALLALLRAKWESFEEIYQASRQMRRFSTRITPKEANILDTCWTWWDNLGVFNVSTAVSFVLAWAWVTIAKHWNRSNTSKCWSSDVLASLGVDINMSPQQVEECVNEIWIWFLFAPIYHSSMKYVSKVRKELWIRTIFNVLGPLTNPANCNMQLVWVFSDRLLKPYAYSLAKYWVKRAMIVAGEDWMDEISLCSKTKIMELNDWIQKEYVFDPSLLGFEYCNLNDIKGGEPQENAEIIKWILSKNIYWPKRDIVVLNSAAWLRVASKANTWEEGILMANNVIDNWLAFGKLMSLIEFSKW